MLSEGNESNESLSDLNAESNIFLLFHYSAVSTI